MCCPRLYMFAPFWMKLCCGKLRWCCAAAAAAAAALLWAAAAWAAAAAAAGVEAGEEDMVVWEEGGAEPEVGAGVPLDEEVVSMQLPCPGFFVRIFSSRRHFARRFENHTWDGRNIAVFVPSTLFSLLYCVSHFFWLPCSILWLPKQCVNKRRLYFRNHTLTVQFTTKFILEEMKYSPYFFHHHHFLSHSRVPLPLPYPHSFSFLPLYSPFPTTNSSLGDKLWEREKKRKGMRRRKGKHWLQSVPLRLDHIWVWKQEGWGDTFFISTISLSCPANFFVINQGHTADATLRGHLRAAKNGQLPTDRRERGGRGDDRLHSLNYPSLPLSIRYPILFFFCLFLSVTATDNNTWHVAGRRESEGKGWPKNNEGVE